MAVSKTARLLSALALAAIVLPGAGFAAEPGFDSRDVVVSTAGLNVANPADQAVLRHRIAVAAHKVCEGLTEGDALASPGYAACFGAATADARAQLNSRIAAAANGSAMVVSR